MGVQEGRHPGQGMEAFGRHRQRPQLLGGQGPWRRERTAVLPGEDGVHPWRAQEHLEGEGKAGGELVSCCHSLHRTHSDSFRIVAFSPILICKAPSCCCCGPNYLIYAKRPYHHQQKIISVSSSQSTTLSTAHPHLSVN